jgi:hypothetical protein
MVEPIENPYGAEAAERWPDAYAESNRRLGRLSPDQQRAVFELGQKITERLAIEFEAGKSFDSDDVQGLVAEHYAWITNFWTPNQQSYRVLGEMYVADARFAAKYESVAVGLADFMRQAMNHFAFAQLD